MSSLNANLNRISHKINKETAEEGDKITIDLPYT